MKQGKWGLLIYQFVCYFRLGRGFQQPQIETYRLFCRSKISRETLRVKEKRVDMLRVSFLGGFFVAGSACSWTSSGHSAASVSSA